MSAHWVGCIFFLMARTRNFDDSTWVASVQKVMPLYRIGENSLWQEYLICLFKGFNRLPALGIDGEACLSVLADLRIVYAQTLFFRCACMYVCTHLQEIVSIFPNAGQVLQHLCAGDIPNNTVETVGTLVTTLFIQVYISALIMGTLLNYLVSPSHLPLQSQFRSQPSLSHANQSFFGRMCCRRFGKILWRKLTNRNSKAYGST